MITVDATVFIIRIIIILTGVCYDNKIIPNGIIFKYVKNEELLKEAKKLIKEKKVCNSYFYKKDANLKRRIAFIKNQYNYFKKYKRYFGNKGLRD